MAPKSDSKTKARKRKEETAASKDGNVSKLDPYELLHVKSDATQGEIKTSYKKLALEHHPDKARGNKDEATKKFQDLTWAYAILSDENRRSIFDKTGSTEAAAEGDATFDWTDFCDAQFQSMVNLQMLDEHKIEYQGSAQERGELLFAFVKHGGDMNRVFEDIIFSNPLHDEERFRAMIEKAIESGEVEAYKVYTQEATKRKQQRLKRAMMEADEAREELKGVKNRKGKSTAENDLAALIRSRQSNRMENFISRLEEEANAMKRPTKKRRVKT